MLLPPPDPDPEPDEPEPDEPEPLLWPVTVTPAFASSCGNSSARWIRYCSRAAAMFDAAAIRLRLLTRACAIKVCSRGSRKPCLYVTAGSAASDWIRAASPIDHEGGTAGSGCPSFGSIVAQPAA